MFHDICNLQIFQDGASKKSSSLKTTLSHFFPETEMKYNQWAQMINKTTKTFYFTCNFGDKRGKGEGY